MTEISELLERVKAATGREVALEREIMCSIGGWQRLSPSQHPRNHKHPMFVDTQEGYGTFEGQTLYRDVPRVMTSIDAALALVERCLPPDTIVVMKQHASGKYFHVEMETDEGDFTAYNHPSMPLAILAALLTALQETQK